MSCQNRKAGPLSHHHDQRRRNTQRIKDKKVIKHTLTYCNQKTAKQSFYYESNVKVEYRHLQSIGSHFHLVKSVSKPRQSKIKLHDMQEKGKNTKKGDHGKSQVTAVDRLCPD